MEVYETLPIVPLRDVVVFPHMVMPFVIGRPSSTRALEHALVKDKRIFRCLRRQLLVVLERIPCKKYGYATFRTQHGLQALFWL